MTEKHITDSDLDLHLRRTLQAVAATVQEVPDVAASTRRHRRGRRMLLGLGSIAIAVPLTTGAIALFGPEHVDQLPPGDVIVAGDIDGERYWMVESFHRDVCGQLMAGVEVVVEERNLIGDEWSTTGYSYGEPLPPSNDGGEVGRCGYDPTEALSNPALSFSGGTKVGDAFLWVYAVHPDVTAVRVIMDGVTQDEPVHPVDGAGYALIELPEGTSSYTVELLMGSDVVPGSKETQEVPRG